MKSRFLDSDFLRIRVRLGALTALGLGVLTGCMNPAVTDPARTGPFFKPVNVAGESQLPGSVRRVVLLPIHGGAIAPRESVAALDAVFLTELQKQNRFEVVVLTREDCLHRYRTESFGSTGTLPNGFMASLRREFAADAVMYVDVTAFKAYRPLVLGVRLKLATLSDEVRLLWSFDNIFSAADPAVANSARHYFLDSDRGNVPADLTPAVLQSPVRYAAYVAGTAFATLPPVFTPPPPPRSGR